MVGERVRREVGGRRVELDAEHEVGRDQGGLQGDAQAGLEVLAGGLGRGDEGEELVDLGVGRRPAPGPVDEGLEDRAAAAGLAVDQRVADHDPRALLVLALHEVLRALDAEPVDQQVAVGHVGLVVIVVGELDGELVHAGLEIDLDLVDLGAVHDGVGVDHEDRRLVHGQVHVREVGAGLLRPHPGAKQVLAGVGDLGGRVDLAVRIEVPGVARRGADRGEGLLGLELPQRRLGDRHRHRLADQALGRELVQLGLQRRGAQHVGDVVEAEAEVVGREAVGRPLLGAQQVPNGVVVLGAVQAMDGDAAWVLGRLARVAAALVLALAGRCGRQLVGGGARGRRRGLGVGRGVLRGGVAVAAAHRDRDQQGPFGRAIRASWRFAEVQGGGHRRPLWSGAGAAVNGRRGPPTREDRGMPPGKAEGRSVLSA